MRCRASSAPRERRLGEFNHRSSAAVRGGDLPSPSRCGGGELPVARRRRGAAVPPPATPIPTSRFSPRRRRAASRANRWRAGQAAQLADAAAARRRMAARRSRSCADAVASPYPIAAKRPRRSGPSTPAPTLQALRWPPRRAGRGAAGPHERRQALAASPSRREALPPAEAPPAGPVLPAGRSASSRGPSALAESLHSRAHTESSARGAVPLRAGRCRAKSQSFGDFERRPLHRRRWSHRNSEPARTRPTAAGLAGTGWRPATACGARRPAGGGTHSVAVRTTDAQAAPMLQKSGEALSYARCRCSAAAPTGSLNRREDNWPPRHFHGLSEGIAKSRRRRRATCATHHDERRVIGRLLGKGGRDLQATKETTSARRRHHRQARAAAARASDHRRCSSSSARPSAGRARAREGVTRRWMRARSASSRRCRLLISSSGWRHADDVMATIRRRRSLGALAEVVPKSDGSVDARRSRRRGRTPAPWPIRARAVEADARSAWARRRRLPTGRRAWPRASSCGPELQQQYLGGGGGEARRARAAGPARRRRRRPAARRRATRRTASRRSSSGGGGGDRYDRRRGRDRGRRGGYDGGRRDDYDRRDRRDDYDRRDRDAATRDARASATTTTATRGRRPRRRRPIAPTADVRSPRGDAPARQPERTLCGGGDSRATAVAEPGRRARSRAAPAHAGGGGRGASGLLADVRDRRATARARCGFTSRRRRRP